MLEEIVAPVRRVLNTLLACHTPPELAAGFTLGMIIGLVPKGNLIALSLCVLLFSLRVNKGLGVASALMFSCFATSIDSFAHKLGLIVLSADSLQVVYASVFNMPLGPWLGFHNTVTSGALLVGIYISYPVYFVTRVTIEQVCGTPRAGHPATGSAGCRVGDGRGEFGNNVPHPSLEAQGRATYSGARSLFDHRPDSQPRNAA